MTSSKLPQGQSCWNISLMTCDLMTICNVCMTARRQAQLIKRTGKKNKMEEQSGGLQRAVLPARKTHAATTDLHRVLEAVVELHLHAPVLGDGVQDHTEEQLPQALENSVWAGTLRFSFQHVASSAT